MNRNLRNLSLKPHEETGDITLGKIQRYGTTAMVHKTLFHRNHQGNRGFVLITFAAIAIVLVAFAGLVVDTAILQYYKRLAQEAADAGAIGGSVQLSSGSGTGVTTAAKADTALNGFTDGSGGVTVTVNNPPLAGDYAGNSGYVEVVVTKSLTPTFIQMVGVNTMSVAARAVAGKGSSSGCVYIMDSSASNALVTSGSGTLNTSCGVYVNSTDSKAVNLSGSACIQSPTSPPNTAVVNIVGSYNNNSSCTPPTFNTGQTAVADPLASVAAPTVGSCTQTSNYSVPSGTAVPSGTYCGGITVSGGGSASFSGTYILLGGGLTVSGGSSITGTGVTFYNTYDATHSYKPIVVSGGSATNISAPTTGAQAGVLFFEDRSETSTSQNTVSGGSGAQFTGALYFLHSPLVYSGGSTTTTSNILIVADTLTISGPSSVGPYAASGSGLGE